MYNVHSATQNSLDIHLAMDSSLIMATGGIKLIMS